MLLEHHQRVAIVASSGQHLDDFRLTHANPTGTSSPSPAAGRVDGARTGAHFQGVQALQVGQVTGFKELLGDWPQSAVATSSGCLLVMRGGWGTILVISTGG